jgi:hypothetical protein
MAATMKVAHIAGSGRGLTTTKLSQKMRHITLGLPPPEAWPMCLIGTPDNETPYTGRRRSASPA